MQERVISKAAAFAALPPVWPEPLLPAIRAHLAAHPTKVVVLDDDPTGTQTVHDIPVLTEWSRETVAAELRSPGPGFYILTNSRAFPTAEACRINREIGERLATVAAELAQDFIVISRSDSTLRGHFPDEVEALGAAAYQPPVARVETTGRLVSRPSVLLCPYFEAGGRYTIGDVHYVADGDRLVPAAQTPFAQDAVFGYRSSNLREWVVEKSRGRISLADVTSLSLADIRQLEPQTLAEQLLLRDGQVCIANCASQRDLEVVVLAAMLAEARGSRTIYRTGASFVATRMGLEPRPLLDAAAFQRSGGLPAAGSSLETATGRLVSRHSGGLVVVGSYVPTTTEQLAHLLERSSIARVELAVDSVRDAATAPDAIAKTTQQVDDLLRAGQDVVLYTSRQLVTGNDADESLRIGQRVSTALVEIVRSLVTPPRFFIAKGGITSSDLATRALGVRRAIVRGQILPGIPVWQLGPESRFPGLNYIVFPGNVGGTGALLEAVQRASGEAAYQPPAPSQPNAAFQSTTPPQSTADLRFLNRFQEIEHTQNRLPHWQQPGATFFVTFRLADSIPQERLDQWSAERDVWLTSHPPPWTPQQQGEYDERFTGAIERWLDEGAGGCELREPRVRAAMERTLRHFDGSRHFLLSAVIMPNHVHTLFGLCGESKLDAVLHSWKGFSAREVNRLLDRRGALWQRDYFDRMIRDTRHCWRCARYIRRNPEVAKLRQGEFTLFEADWVRDWLDRERSGGLPAAGSSLETATGRLVSRPSDSPP